MKNLLLALSLSAPLIAQTDTPHIDQQAVFMYIESQCKAQRAIAQQAAKAFGFPAERVKICPVLQEGPCPKRHDNDDLVLHIAPQNLTTHPELARFDIYRGVYIQTQLRKSPVITSKQRKNFIWGAARTAVVGAASYALMSYLQNSPLVSAGAASSVAACSALLFDRNNLMYKFPSFNQFTKQELRSIMPAHEAAVDLGVCKALLAQGHQDTVFLRLAQLYAERKGLVHLKPLIATKLDAKEQAVYEYHMQSLTGQIQIVERLLAACGIRQVENEIARVESNNFDMIFRPMLEQLMTQMGPLGIAQEYRHLLHAKVQQGDRFTPYGISVHTALKKMKEFCTEQSINLATALSEMALLEQKALITEIEKAHKAENGQRVLKKMLAQLRIYCEMGVDTELDGNENLKKLIKHVETALAKYPKS